MTFDDLNLRGTLTPDFEMSKLSWLRVGGPATALFQPADLEDLRHFLKHYQEPIFPLGVGSNMIIRDGGLDAVVIKLGRGFNNITSLGDGRLEVGAAALDGHVARKAADFGVDLTFLRTIPGSIGGAVRMNAGCYGSYLCDHLISAQVLLREGELIIMDHADFKFRYRGSFLPDDAIILSAVLKGVEGNPEKLHAKMEKQLERRAETQPVRELSCGSTFRNPSGFSSTGKADDPMERKAWWLIEAAQMKGARLGKAQMSEKHANFLINTGGATARELEELGEAVRKKVYEAHKIQLEWEIMRVGKPLNKETF